MPIATALAGLPRRLATWRTLALLLATSTLALLVWHVNAR